MADRSITLKIAGKEFPLIAHSPETESLMRAGAEHVNEVLKSYDQKFPNTMLLDKLAFVALNEAIGRITAQVKLNGLNQSVQKLDDELSAYIKDKED